MLSHKDFRYTGVNWYFRLIMSLMVIPKSHNTRTCDFGQSLRIDRGTNGVLALLDGHAFLSSPAVLGITGWSPQPSASGCLLGLADRRHCRENAARRSQGFLSLVLSAMVTSRRYLLPAKPGETTSSMWPWSLSGGLTPSPLHPYCFLLFAVPRFLSSYLAFSFSHHFWNQLPESNSLHLNFLLVCALMVGHWQSFHLNIKSLPELVLLVEN